MIKLYAVDDQETKINAESFIFDNAWCKIFTTEGRILKIRKHYYHRIVASPGCMTTLQSIENLRYFCQ